MLKATRKGGVLRSEALKVPSVLKASGRREEAC
jgi:hypothetical protein